MDLTQGVNMKKKRQETAVYGCGFNCVSIVFFAFRFSFCLFILLVIVILPKPIIWLDQVVAFLLLAKSSKTIMPAVYIVHMITVIFV